MRTRRAVFSALVPVVPSLLIALVAWPSLANAWVRASFTTLGRDQGIFQYVAWATAHGERAYRDVRDVNGPLVILVHRALQKVGGPSEHAFRVQDLCLTALTAAFAGACLFTLERSPRGPAEAPPRRTRTLRALGLALGAAVLVTAQYLGYGYWSTAQRESFFDWFVLVAIGAQLLASYGVAPMAMLAVAGALSVIPWFGKPTYVLFTAGQLATLLLDDARSEHSKRAQVLCFAAGGALGALVPLGFLVFWGDLRAWLRISLVDVPAMYRFIWPRNPSVILFGGTRALTGMVAATSAGVVALVVRKYLPRRALVLAFLPVLGLASAVVQAKGFYYHLHPASLGVALALLVLLDFTAQTAATMATDGFGLALRIFVVGAAVTLGARAGRMAARSGDPSVPVATDEAFLESSAHLSKFVRYDFFPDRLRDAARYIDAQTQPGERVQMYGMDPYLLFLAQRKSATPYIYAYDLNVDAALAGSADPGGLRPSEAQRAAIVAIRDAHERDLEARLVAEPPPLFVFVDNSPLMTLPDARADFEAHCPSVAAWVAEHYRETETFGPIHVFMRSDRVP